MSEPRDIQDFIRAISTGRMGPDLPPPPDSALGTGESEVVPLNAPMLQISSVQLTAWVFFRVQLFNPANMPKQVVTFDAPYWTSVMEARIVTERALSVLDDISRDKEVLRVAAGIPYQYPKVSGIPGVPGKGLGIFPSWIVGYDFVDTSKNTKVRRMFSSMYCAS